jgi:hypothetical protein
MKKRSVAQQCGVQDAVQMQCKLECRMRVRKRKRVAHETHEMN